MREEEKIFAGVLFAPGDDSLRAIKLRTHNVCTEYNLTFEDEVERRAGLINHIFASFGENGFIQGPLFVHYGIHTTIGKNFFGNFNLTIQDDAKVQIGDHCSFGPNVTIVTPVHPMLPHERRGIMDKDGNMKHMCYAKPVKIGNDCWFGANVVVCPGVTIGDNCVIGAGSVVVRDIPPNSLAAGNPCRVIREITDADSMIHKPEVLADNQIVK